MASSAAVALCGLLFVTVALAQLPPLPPMGTAPKILHHERVLTDADPTEVKPGYWMNCPDPVCANTNTMGPLHWRYVGGSDTNRIDIEYHCDTCGTQFWVRKSTH